MKIHEVKAKTIISTTRSPEMWFGVHYNMNIYRGCQHGCIYCDSRSQCYGIENFDDMVIKINAAELLQSTLSRKRKKGLIGTGAMSDPYVPIEKKYQLTRQALEIIARYGYPLQLTTKSDMILRDIELLKRINQTFACVAFTLTTVDDKLAKIIEPGAPLPSARLKAMQTVAQAGIYTGVLMMPILPWLEDSLANVSSVISASLSHGASFIIPCFGLTLRDQQRDYYYQQLDKSFPGLSQRYRLAYGNDYFCASSNAPELKPFFYETCRKNHLVYQMKNVKTYKSPNDKYKQMRLFTH